MTESNLKATIRLLSETANMDVTEWIASRNWLGRHEKELQAMELVLREVWNLGRNVVLQWSMAEGQIEVLAIPLYVLATDQENQQEAIKQILMDRRMVDNVALRANAGKLGYDTVPLPLTFNASHLPLFQVNDMVSRFGPSYVEDQAVVLFDIVGFSLLTPLEQVAQINSLSYSLNSAHARMLQRDEINFVRSTTGDGFYVWNRDSSIQANINLYHYMHLALADNAIARSKSEGSNVTPQLRAAFHVGSHYEFKQSEGLHPISSSYIVGDVTIELARLVEHTKPGQVLVGDFMAPMVTASGDLEHVSALRFIELTQGTLASLQGMVLSGDRIDAIRCYLTGDKVDDQFTVRRHTILDKHGISRDAYNAKINIYRENSAPIYLGLQDHEV